MSTVQIGVSHDGWISQYRPDTVLSGAKLYSASPFYLNIGNGSNVTAYLQFEVPKAVLLKKITRATLYYYVNDDYFGVAYGNLDVAYNPFLIGSLEGVTYNTVNHYTVGEAKVVNRRLDRPQWISEDVTDIFQNNIVNGIFAVLVSCGLLSSADKYVTYLGGKSGNNASYMVVEYEEVEQLPPTVSYPSGVYVREGEPVTFSWIYNSLTQATQAGATIQWRVKGTTDWNTISVDSEAHYYISDAIFPQGTIEWRVCVTNSIDETSAYSESAEFTVQGKPTTPIFMDVENKCLPCIRWNAADQCAYEIELVHAGTKMVHETVYSCDSEYRPQAFLNGTYTVTLRTRNSIDLWSDKASKTFVINPPVPAVPQVTMRQDGARIILDVEHEEGTKVAIIRNGEVIAITSESSYEDNTILSGVEYEYKVRAYSDGYADSATISGLAYYDGFILKGEEKEVNCTVSEQKFLNLSIQDEQEAELIHYEGRAFPVLEAGNSKKIVITRTVIVTDEQYRDLLEISKAPAHYRDKEGNGFACAVSIGSCNRYMGMRYSLTLTMTRIDAEEVLLNE